LAETLRSIADAIETCCPDSTANGCCGTKTLDHPTRAERRKS
jgi:hypothetical protein